MTQRVRIAITPLPSQRTLMRSNAFVRVILGWYGSGKTTGAALALIRHVLANPWRAEYGASNPFTLITSSTVSVLRDSAVAELRRLIPAELIMRETKQPLEWTMVNGHVLKFKAQNSITGASASGAWIDEAHKLRDRSVFVDLQARVRDPLARSRVLLVSGLPERGWLSDLFETPGEGDRLVVHAKVSDNVNLPASFLAEARQTLSKTEAAAYLDGTWIRPEGQVYFEFDPARNVTPIGGDRNAITHVALDVGEQSCALFGQVVQIQARDATGATSPSPKLRVVDQVIARHSSTQDVCREIKRRGWRLTSESTLSVDPTIRIDELRAIASELPDLRVVRRSRKGGDDDVERGYAEVNRAFRDADDNVRLEISRSLGNAEGLLVALPRLRRAPSGRVHAQDKIDHSTDALRYLVQTLIPCPHAGQYRVMDRR